MTAKIIPFPIKPNAGTKVTHVVGAVRLQPGSWQAQCGCGWRSPIYSTGHYVSRAQHARNAAAAHSERAAVEKARARQ